MIKIKLTQPQGYFKDPETGVEIRNSQRAIVPKSKSVLTAIKMGRLVELEITKSEISKMSRRDLNKLAEYRGESAAGYTKNELIELLT